MDDRPAIRPAKLNARRLAEVAFGLAAMTAPAPPADAEPPPMHTYVTLEGVRYHVTTLKTRVRVAGDPVAALPSPETRELMRRAVTEGTGCRIVEDRWVADELHGRLDCTDRLPVKDW